MDPDTQSQLREALLDLHRQLQGNADRLAVVECDDPSDRVVFKALYELYEKVSEPVAETALLVPVKVSVLAQRGLSSSPWSPITG